MVSCAAAADVMLSRVTGEDLQLLPPNETIKTKGAQDNLLGNGQISLILVDTQAIWNILPIIIYPSQTPGDIDDYLQLTTRDKTVSSQTAFVIQLISYV